MQLKNCLYLIANPDYVEPIRLEEVVKEATAGGVDIVQLRGKGKPASEVFELAINLKKVLTNKQVKFLVNDRIDVAMAVDADGVHLPQNSIPPEAARKLIGSDKIIGVSTHSLKEAQEAERKKADYIIYSHIFPTRSKPGLGPKGVEALVEIAEKVEIPVVALGGINANNIKQLTACDITNIAVMSEILKADNPKEKARELKKVIKTK